MLNARYLLSRVMLGVMPPDVPVPPPPPMPPNLPPPMFAAPPPPQQGFNRKYLLGIGIGLIPLLLAMIGLGETISASRGGPANSFLSSLLVVGGILYLAEIIAMIVLLVIRRTRPIGYGLLTTVAISPIVFAISCFALFAAIPY